MNERLQRKLESMPPASTPRPRADKPAAAAAPSPAAELPPPNDVECYYDAAKKTYWTLNARGEWHDLNSTNLRLHLRSHGYRPERFPSKANGLNEVEAKTLEITHVNGVHYAGQVAGYPAGVHEISGQVVLVTRGPNLIEPRSGKFPNLQTLFTQLLGRQRSYFYGWLKVAREALMSGPPWRSGQLLAIAGPPGSGKSLVQNLITHMLGGRVAKPYRYMTGATTFNGDLLAAEHLAIEDEPSSKDQRTRQAFGASLKSFCVCQTQSSHKKTVDANTLTPFWRVTITLNDEPESLLVMPPITSDLEDKIILLKASPATMPYAAGDQAGYHGYWQTLLDELPAFLWKLDRWEIPATMRDVRYGVTHWANPELLQSVHSLASEHQLWELIVGSSMFDGGFTMWEGTAIQLKKRLKESHPPAEVDRVLSWPAACGVYLTRLAKMMPNNVFVQKQKNNSPATYKVIGESIE